MLQMPQAGLCPIRYIFSSFLYGHLHKFTFKMPVHDPFNKHKLTVTTVGKTVLDFDISTSVHPESSLAGNHLQAFSTQ